MTKKEEFVAKQKKVKVAQLRADEVKQSLPVASVFKGKPNNGKYFVVDKVVEQ